MNKHGHHHHNGHGHTHGCVPCFVAGSSVTTRNGLVNVEDIKPGMYVLTRDNGFKEVSWAETSIGTGFYAYDGTRFSPNHRVLQYREEEVLVPAKKLETATYHDSTVTFVHFMLDMHEIVMVDGVWSESFYPGPYIMDNMQYEAAQEIKKLFPEFCTWELARKEIKK